ncbi:hypothetical protein B484DRAFT_395404 [Ochromonadaceae sp. CCMP2298]|nr:hypothetical protein B484DRAFT_395404 [Ochromonadaceae sp. CCMP2298]
MRLLLLLALTGLASSLRFLQPLGIRSAALRSTLLDQIEDADDLESFQRIAATYLKYKFMDCVGDDCKFSREVSEVSELLKGVLPPVSAAELDREVSKVMSKLSSDPIDADAYVEAVMGNSFWEDAGFLVVKELIFLDCVHSFYFKKQSLLPDNLYIELKEQLAWEGSVAASIEAKEAHFITAVAAAQRGSPILSDTDYMSLKAQLQQQGSWVVNRKPDPLEKLGLTTFLSYLHRSL